jgi:hypothetical protein
MAPVNPFPYEFIANSTTVDNIKKCLFIFPPVSLGFRIYDTIMIVFDEIKKNHNLMIHKIMNNLLQPICSFILLEK